MNYLISILSAFLIFFVVSFWFIYKQNQHLKFSIRSQNLLIEQKELEIKEYEKRKPLIVEKIVNKYSKVQVKDDKCENQMEGIRSLLSEWNKR